MPDKTMPDTDITISKDANIRTGRNDPVLTEEFRDLGFGMFIHYSLDCLIGSVISHWMIGADPSIVNDFIDNWPARFRPEDLDISRWAALARQAGAKYAVLTAKHHNGFCLWDTATTPFNVMNTPCGRDIVAEFLSTFRSFGIKPGLYFSPFDFYYNFRMKKRVLQFATPDMLQENDPEMLDYNTRQVNELVSKYGPVYCFFFDGPPDTLKASVWNAQPKCLITRGEMETPENVLPTEAIPRAWEACYTGGSSWGYMPGDPAEYDAKRFIQLLMKIRSRGGNLLLNVSPDPHGVIPRRQEEMLQQIGLFNFFNREAVYGVRPFDVVCEDDESVYYSRSRDGKTVYACLMDGMPFFGYKGHHGILLRKLRAEPGASVRMLGSNNMIMEHRPGNDCGNYCSQTPEGLLIDAILSMRPSESRDWKMPVVFALEGVTAVK